MKIILDTNIIISALVRNSFTREIIMLSEDEFYYLKMNSIILKKHLMRLKNTNLLS